MDANSLQVIVQAFLAVAGALNVIVPLYQAWNRRKLATAEVKKTTEEAEKIEADAVKVHADASATIVSTAGSAVELSKTMMAHIRDENALLKARLDRTEAELTDMRRQQIEEIARLRSEQNAENASLRLSHADEMSKLRTEYGREIESMKRLYAALLRRYKEDQAGIERLIRQLEGMGVQPVWRPEKLEF